MYLLSPAWQAHFGSIGTCRFLRFYSSDDNWHFIQRVRIAGGDPAL